MAPVPNVSSARSSRLPAGLEESTRAALRAGAAGLVLEHGETVPVGHRPCSCGGIGGGSGLSALNRGLWGLWQFTQRK